MGLISLIILSTIASFLLSLFVTTSQKRKEKCLPPGPRSIPFIGNISWFFPSFSSITPSLHKLRAKYGPIVTLHVGQTPAIFIMNSDLANRSLVRMSRVFSYRPPPLGTIEALPANHSTINMASFNSQWKLIRHNLSSFLTTYSSSSSSSPALYKSLDMLVKKLHSESKNEGVIIMLSEMIKNTMFQFFTFICFGEELNELLLDDLRGVQLRILGLAVKLSVFNLIPKFLMVVFLPRLYKLFNLLKMQEKLIIPIIKAHRLDKRANKSSYLDSLLSLRVQEEGGRELTDQEIINLCSEFIDASTETISATLEWMMSRIINHESIQEKLFKSLQENCNGGHSINVNDLKNASYLKAVVLESLRLHPPAHFLFPHTLEETVNLERYTIPKGAIVNYAVTEIGRDGNVWKDPLEYKPERFLNSGERGRSDEIGSREIKMIPFGAGGRRCPGEGMAMFVLEYFVANLVSKFEWKSAVEGERIDMTELPGLVVNMRHPLRTRLFSRN